MDRVLALSNRLREGGIECQIDQYEFSPPEGWPNWCTEQVEESDFVLVACTETYLRRFRGKEAAGLGLGGTWEGHVITQELYNAQGRNSKFVPIVFGAEDRQYIPLTLQSATNYHLDAEYDRLYRYLTNQPEIVAPPIGGVMPMLAREPLQALPAIEPKHSMAQGRGRQMEGVARPTRPAKLFFSYSHEDEKLRNKLAKHLMLLERQGFLSGWHDRQIIAGQDWTNEIGEHARHADIILLLISPDFLASDYCFNVEMEAALQRHDRGEASVIPIILRPVHWQSAPFAKLQPLPKNGKAVTTFANRDLAFQEIEAGIRAVAQLGGRI
jgi:hypothetical protein